MISDMSYALRFVPCSATVWVTDYAKRDIVQWEWPAKCLFKQSSSPSLIKCFYSMKTRLNFRWLFEWKAHNFTFLPFFPFSFLVCASFVHAQLPFRRVSFRQWQWRHHRFLVLDASSPETTHTFIVSTKGVSIEMSFGVDKRHSSSHAISAAVNRFDHACVTLCETTSKKHKWAKAQN